MLQRSKSLGSTTMTSSLSRSTAGARRSSPPSRRSAPRRGGGRRREGGVPILAAWSRACVAGCALNETHFFVVPRSRHLQTCLAAPPPLPPCMYLRPARAARGCPQDHMECECPPSTRSSVAVTKEASDDRRKTAARAISSASAYRPNGMTEVIISLVASIPASSMPVVSQKDDSLAPGASALTRIPFGASSLARQRDIESAAALVTL
mmetsp:Transcript_11955/g.50286  ORF Transcript_11955/g.50286 Transcript_11955/m.50286 type:complete len:208 (+) Transcript_11955:756-1379(+)